MVASLQPVELLRNQTPDKTMKMRTFFALLCSIVLLNTVLPAWIEIDGAPALDNELILQLAEKLAPKLGMEAPLILADLPELSPLLAKHPVADLKPLYIHHATFNEAHYRAGLHRFYVLTFADATDLPDLRRQLLVTGLITAVDFNYQTNVATVPNDPMYPQQWAHDNYGQVISDNGGTVGDADCDMDTDEAWDLTQGDEEIIIAILDTGVSNHVELEGKILPGWNVPYNNSNVNDVYGHGTHCAGIAAAHGDNDVGIAGISWGSPILPVKVLTDSGSGDQTDLANGIQWATDNGARVISMSLAWDNYVTAAASALEYAWNQGTVPLAATGNYDSGVMYPAAYDYCIAVGALSSCNERKSYSSCDGENYWGSNYGAELEFLAPGVRIATINNYGGYYDYFNGTSSACPQAAGVAALVLSVTPTLTSDQVREVLQQSSVDLYGAGWDAQSGYGRLNAYNAVSLSFELNCSNFSIPGDVNADELINILDMVIVTNIILGVLQDPGICELWAADFDGNEIINVLDIIQMINAVVNDG